MLVAVVITAPVFRVRAATVTQTGEYEGRTIADVQIIIEGPARDPSNPCGPTTAAAGIAAARGHAATATAPPRDQAVESELLSLLHVAPNSAYSILRIRESLEALFREGSVACARVEVNEVGGAGSPLRLLFIVRRQVRVGEVK